MCNMEPLRTFQHMKLSVGKHYPQHIYKRAMIDFALGRTIIYPRHVDLELDQK